MKSQIQLEYENMLKEEAQADLEDKAIWKAEILELYLGV
jgi:hypothetical protein